jgi:type IV secretion system protein VirB8
MPDDLVRDWSALPILDPDRAAYHKQVRSFQADQFLQMRRQRNVAIGVAGGAFGAVLALSLTVVNLVPLQRLVPLYIVVHDDGTVESDVSMAGRPPAEQERMIQAAVWRYVQERQSYSFADARHRYDLVSLMSGDQVRDGYQNWFLSDPASPQKTVGKNGQIDIQEISMSVIRDGVVLVRFWQTTTMYQAPLNAHKQSMSATVQYELAGSVSAKTIMDNPTGLRIVRYQVEENSP